MASESCPQGEMGGRARVWPSWPPWERADRQPWHRSCALLQDRPSPMPYKEVPEAMAASMLLGAPPEDREWGVGGEERG